jgi:hypothetical protein
MPRTKLAISVAAMIVVAVGGIWIGQRFGRWVTGPANAQERLPEVTQPAAATSAIQATPISENIAAIGVSVQQTDGQSANEQPADFELLKALNAKSAEKFLKPGWIHFAFQSISDNDDGSNGDLGNGQVIPLNYISESWYRLNEKGEIVESVSLMIANDGQIVQVGTLSDGVARNLTTNYISEGQSPIPLYLDFGFVRDATQAKEEGLQVTQTTASLDGRKVLVFVIRQSYEMAQKIVGYDQPVTSIEQQALYDPDTGQLVQRVTVVKLADGTERVGSGITSVTIEPIGAPPDNVLDYLNMEVVK